MKRIIAIIAVALIVQGCATAPPTAAQLVQVCTNAQVTIDALRSLQTLPVAAQADLDAVAPLVVGACSVGTVNLTSMTTFNETVFPALQKAIDAGVTDAAKHDQLVGLVLAAQIIVTNMSAGL